MPPYMRHMMTSGLCYAPDDGGGGGAGGAGGADGGQGQAGGAASGDGAGDGADGGGEATPAWLEGLGDTHNQFLQAKGLDPKSLKAADLIDMTQGAEKLLGGPRENLLQAPTDPDKLFEWDGWKKIGVPETADGYKVARPELPEGMQYDESLEAAVIEAAVSSKMHPKQVQALVDTFAKHQTAAMEAWQAESAEKLAADKASIEAELKKDGLVPKDTYALADAAAKALGLNEKVGDVSLLDHFAMTANGEAAFVKKLADIGKRLGEDQWVGKGDQDFNAAKAASAQIAQLKGDKDFTASLTDKMHPTHKANLAKWQDLHRRAAEEDA